MRALRIEPTRRRGALRLPVAGLLALLLALAVALSVAPSLHARALLAAATSQAHAGHATADRHATANSHDDATADGHGRAMADSHDAHLAGPACLACVLMAAPGLQPRPGDAPGRLAAAIAAPAGPAVAEAPAGPAVTPRHARAPPRPAHA